MRYELAEIIRYFSLAGMRGGSMVEGHNPPHMITTDTLPAMTTTDATTTKSAPLRYANTEDIPARYNFAQAMPNAILPQYWLARATYRNATHRIYRANSGAVLRTVSLG